MEEYTNMVDQLYFLECTCTKSSVGNLFAGFVDVHETSHGILQEYHVHAYLT